MQKKNYPTYLFFKLPIKCEKTGATGHVLFKEVQAQPLSLDDWLQYTGSNDLTLRIFGKIASKPSWDDQLPSVGDSIKVNHTISPILGNTCLALVRGGWVPLIHTFSESHIIADRNIISEINARFKNGISHPTNRADDDFIDHLINKECSCTILTISYALEGNERRLPSSEKIKEQHGAAYRTISNALPHIKVWPKVDSDLDHICELADSYRVYFNDGMKLLTKLAPMVINPPARGKRVQRWKEMAELAQKEGISLDHIAFMAILSASSGSQQFNPAHKLIKPKSNYSEEDAYNSMYDLFLIGLAHTMQTQAPDNKVALVTRDKNLASFWMGLTFAEAPSPDQLMIGLHKHLLPVSDEELYQLTQILGNNRIYQSWTLPPKPRY